LQALRFALLVTVSRRMDTRGILVRHPAGRTISADDFAGESARKTLRFCGKISQISVVNAPRFFYYFLTEISRVQ
jgi:hypothetical protein